MTRTPLPRVLAGLLTLVVAAVAGAYLVIYLYRWEWNRAVISGLFFLAAEIAYIGSSLRGEIGGLRARIDELEAGAAEPAGSVPPTPSRTAPPAPPAARPAQPFAWLRESASGQLGVFVPVLLGAGVILSGLAFVVERVAALVVRPWATGASPGARRTVGPLGPLDLPPGGLLAAPAASDARPTGGRAADGRAAGSSPTRRLLGETGGRRAARWQPGAGRLGTRIVAVLLVAVIMAIGIDLLADATQSRPSPRQPGASTVIELVVDQRRPRPAIEAAEALAVACHSTLHADSEFTGIATVRGDHVRLEVAPALSELRRRRLFGCLQDATLDLVQAHVVSWSTVPSAPAPDADQLDPAVPSA